MKKLLIAFMVVGTFAACKTTKTPKQKPLEETKIEDFSTFLTLKLGDPVEKAFGIFGEPTTNTKDKNDRYSFISNYYDDADKNRMMSFTYDKKDKTINHIRLTGNYREGYTTTKAFLAAHGIKDIKANFLGMHKDDIIKIMGQPDRVNSGNYEYKKGHVSITFICYEFRDHKCSEMYLFWNKYYKEPTE